MKLATVGSALLCLLFVGGGSEASPLFSDNTIIEVQITGPFDELIDNKERRDELPFTLTANGQDHDVKIRVRGKSRIELCKFTPLRVNFKKGDTRETLFSGQDKLKLATHCRASEAAEKYVIHEYAAYRIFNQITDISYRVRLARLTYAESDGRIVAERFGFFIENDNELAKRVGGESAKIAAIKRSMMDPSQAGRAYVFQYMIGNTDWSLVASDGEEFCCHNNDLFRIDDMIYQVPYDFDMSGLVSTRYARPNPSLRIRSVRVRRYRGYCMPSGALAEPLAHVKSLQSDIMAVYGELPLLSEKDANAKVSYLTDFFAKADDEAALVAEFERRCI